MCRLYGFRATEPTKVECTLVHAQNALMVQSAADRSGKSHANGWGVATFESDLPHVERQAWAAYHGEHFQRAAARIYSKQVVAHVRRATVGAPSLENTHPFSDGGWVFAHNGTVPHFDEIRPSLLRQIPVERRRLVLGQTDSEHIFHLIRALQVGRPGHPTFQIVREVVGWLADRVREIDPNAKIGLNIILTDGRDLIGTRIGRPLRYVERAGVRDCEICGFPHVNHDPQTDYRAIVLASEPISHERWREVPENAIYKICSDCRIAWEPLELGAR
ncbi:MAG: class II glutamine amidotransferase [Erythrobacter sp.]|uniref:class II glutamine amidotransferase n=1 Tax=Erythrobacter sp. TaxID=1042 RepID=UPI00260620D4|nr:class II glutamine amidotransferase [Erythrobacter sp.]MDJ0977566.1 class II glutamine amidotransferase [Erythrobacter sp.]